MVEKNVPPTITEQIDADAGLKYQRKLLIATSLIILVLSFSGATIGEANTFILKLEFENEYGISILLCLGVAFLLLRYYNYAYKYHQQLHELWSDRLIRDPFFIDQEFETGEHYGYLVDMEPKGFSVEAFRYEDTEWSYHYVCRPILRRKIAYSWNNQHEYGSTEHVNIEWKNYPKILGLEAKYQFKCLVTHRENLDILSPYFLAFLAMLSYVFKEELKCVLKALS